jgi:pimeloyl-ACP methyl ester carboxylesterase
MATFILVHGAWHGGWCWEMLTPLLEQAGHTVVAKDLPGMGQDRTPFAVDVLAQWAEAVAADVAAASSPVILVGHSRGGLVISEVAERVGPKIARLVYLTAFLLPAGVSLTENVMSRGEGTGLVLVIDEATGTCTVQPGTQHEVFYHLCSAADAAAAVDRLCPEPLEPLVRGVRVTEAGFGAVPRAYIEAAHDQAIVLDHQRAMQALFPCSPVLQLESDHSPFYSMPEQLAAALLQLA